MPLYADTLKIAEQNGISALILNIAYEVKYQLDRLDDLDDPVDATRYEDYCEAVYNLCILNDGLPVEMIVEALFECMQYPHEEGSDRVADIDNILAYGEDYYTVKEYAYSL